MVLIGAVCGVGLAVGLTAVVFGIRGTPPPAEPKGRSVSGGSRLLRGVATAAVGIVTLAVTGWPVAAVVSAVLGWIAVARFSGGVDGDGGGRGGDEVARGEAVAAWTEMLRDTLSAAAGLEQAVAASASAAPEAIREPVRRLAVRVEREPLADSLHRFADEVANPAADLVVAALVTAARREARDLVPLLDTLARSTRAEVEMRRRVDAGRARIRTAARVITVTLGLFAGGLVVFNPAYLAAYDTAVGQLVLAGVVLLFGGGLWLLNRMARLEGPPRFFGGVRQGGVG